MAIVGYEFPPLPWTYDGTKVEDANGMVVAVCDDPRVAAFIVGASAQAKDFSCWKCDVPMVQAGVGVRKAVCPYSGEIGIINPMTGGLLSPLFTEGSDNEP